MTVPRVARPLITSRPTMRHLAISLLVVGCAGSPPPNAGGDVDAGADAPAVVGPKLSGKTMDYFGNVALADSTVTTDGIDPPMTATSAVDGAYELLNVPPSGLVILNAARPEYRPTRNVAIPVAEVDVVQDIYQLSVIDVNRQYTTALGRLPVAGLAFVAVELQRNNGTPLEGVPLADVVLVDALDQPVPNVTYVFMGQTDVDPTILQSTAVNGRARVALLDVPPGAFTLKVTTLNGMGQPQILTTPIAAIADGATLGKIGGMTPGGGGGSGNITDPLFSVDIYPRLQRVALGGIGCANCHTLGGQGAILILDDGAATVLARLNPPAANGRLDTITPANSMLLTKPLYELTPPQDHPNATFLDINDDNYKHFLLWIQNGLKP